MARVNVMIGRHVGNALNICSFATLSQGQSRSQRLLRPRPDPRQSSGFLVMSYVVIWRPGNRDTRAASPFAIVPPTRLLLPPTRLMGNKSRSIRPTPPPPRLAGLVLRARNRIDQVAPPKRQNNVLTRVVFRRMPGLDGFR